MSIQISKDFINENFKYNSPQTMLMCHCAKCDNTFLLLPSMEKVCPLCKSKEDKEKLVTKDKIINILFAKIRKLEKDIKVLQKRE